MAPPPTCDSAVSPCFHGCLAFLHRHFPSQSPPSPPLNRSLQSTAAPALGSLHTPQTPAPRRCTFQGTLAPFRGMYSCGEDCLILIPFRLPQISCFILSLRCSSSGSDKCPEVEVRPLLQFLHQPSAGPVLLTLLFFPLVPLSCKVLSGSVYSFSTGQVLLPTLSWCSACTSVSEGVFLMYPRREMYSMSTYSSAIFISP